MTGSSPYCRSMVSVSVNVELGLVDFVPGTGRFMSERSAQQQALVNGRVAPDGGEACRISRSMRVSSFLLTLSVLLTPVMGAFAQSTAADCARLNMLHLPGVTAINAGLIEAGGLKFTDGSAAPGLKAFCRIRATAVPSKDSDIRFEVWLPASDWNGRLWGIGNGWFAGSISEQGLATHVAAGYATVSTDTGHHTSYKDTSWALGHPEKIIDFGHRAIHLAAQHAKRIAAAFYGHAPDHSYFSSCSNGGREALMEAQRYPEDYDGIIAGAAAADWTHIFEGAALINVKWLADGPSYLPGKKLPAIHAAVLAACDSLDGIKDGVIDDPRRCEFDPSVLLCHGSESDTCLTAEQVGTLRNLYKGPTLKSGKPLMPGFSPGVELGWNDALTGDGPGKNGTYQPVTDFFRNMVFGDSHWDAHSYNVEQAALLADRKWSSVLNATDPDISKFIGRGGKLILYHGWNDPLVPPMSSIDYYTRMMATAGKVKADSAVRLFMAPGMDHCGGGSGPNEFGEFEPGNGDPRASIGAALQHWVEQGVAPEYIVATKHKEEGDPPDTVAVRTRPLCAYPSVAVYRGKGSTDQAESFTCGAATR